MKTNRSVERALSILLFVCQSERSLSLTEISKGAGLDKATTLRFLHTLINADMIRYEEGTRRYLQGAGIYSFWPNEIRNLCRPHLQQLLSQVQETICLIAPRGKKRVCLDAIEPDRELRIVAPVGRELPIYAGASGSVFMAYKPAEQVEAILNDPDSALHGPEFVADRRRYLSRLKAVKDAGYAHYVDDVTMGTSTIAAPVFDGLGNIAASVAVRGPTTRMKKQVIDEVAKLAAVTAKGISSEIANMNN